MKYVIIGVGAAGIEAAKTIREKDKTSSIVMLSNDEFVHSRCMLHKFLNGERDENTLNFVDSDFFTDNNIFWIKNAEVTSIDTNSHELKYEMADNENVDTLQYDKLLIATGADSFIPPINNFREASNVFGLRNLSDAVAIKKIADTASKILIIGSGLVGLDAAYSFLEDGKDVTVVEMMDRILPIQLDEVAGKPYQDLFEAHGCKFLLGKKAVDTTISDNGNITSVILDDGTNLPCDLVIVAAGVRASIALTNGSDIKAERFIEVNEFMQTSNPDVYAAGDVAGLSGIWPNAKKQGQVAAYNMQGTPMQYVDRYAMKNTMNFYGLTTLSLGRGEIKDGDIVIKCEDSKSYRRAIFRDGKLDSILLQGPIDYSGIYQYIIKNELPLKRPMEDIFKVSFADYFATEKDGQYMYK